MQASSRRREAPREWLRRATERLLQLTVEAKVTGHLGRWGSTAGVVERVQRSWESLGGRLRKVVEVSGEQLPPECSHTSQRNYDAS